MPYRNQANGCYANASHHLFLVYNPCLIFVLAFAYVVMLCLMLRRVFALLLLGRNANLSLFLIMDNITTGLDLDK